MRVFPIQYVYFCFVPKEVERAENDLFQRHLTLAKDLSFGADCKDKIYYLR